ncbi:MAG: hypothetical protein QOG44_2332, partial [Acidimicrobiaceae bacterium]|nr:hypothetical protein [Acidimicrobiaceae bacterium]
MARNAPAAAPGAGRRPLALFDPPEAAPRTKAAPRLQASTRSDWERPLRAILAHDTQAPGHAPSPEIGLQFELVTARPRAGRRSAAIGPGIRVRPVLPGRTGNWVRTGVNWSNLDYVGYGRPKTAGSTEKLSLLKEFLALSRLSDTPYSYAYSNVEIWLEEIKSRRLWDLLRQARDLQLPLVSSGRKALPVVLTSSSAEV